MGARAVRHFVYLDARPQNGRFRAAGGYWLRYGKLAANSKPRITIALDYFLWLWHLLYNSLNNIIYLKEVNMEYNASYIAGNI